MEWNGVVTMKQYSSMGDKIRTESIWVQTENDRGICAKEKAPVGRAPVSIYSIIRPGDSDNVWRVNVLFELDYQLLLWQPNWPYLCVMSEIELRDRKIRLTQRVNKPSNLVIVFSSISISAPEWICLAPLINQPPSRPVSFCNAERRIKTVIPHRYPLSIPQICYSSTNSIRNPIAQKKKEKKKEKKKNGRLIIKWW